MNCACPCRCGREDGICSCACDLDYKTERCRNLEYVTIGNLAHGKHENGVVVTVPGLDQATLNARLTKDGWKGVHPGLHDWLLSIKPLMEADGYPGVALKAGGPSMKSLDAASTVQEAEPIPDTDPAWARRIEAVRRRAHLGGESR